MPNATQKSGKSRALLKWWVALLVFSAFTIILGLKGRNTAGIQDESIRTEVTNPGHSIVELKMPLPPTGVVDPPPIPPHKTPPIRTASADQKNAITKIALKIQSDWRKVNESLREAPREVWNQAAMEFRAANYLLIQQVEEFYGQPMNLVHPSEVMPNTPNPAFPQPPNSMASGPNSLRQNPALVAYQKEFISLQKERQELISRISGDTPLNQEKQVKEWESKNATRLSAHRRAAMELKQITFDSPTPVNQFSVKNPHQ